MAVAEGTGGLEPLVVRTADLAHVLARWRKQHEAEHPYVPSKGWAAGKAKSPYGGQYDREERKVMPVTGPWQYLKERCGIDESTIGRIVRLGSEVTMLSVADELLRAADLEHCLSNGEVEIIPNPRLSPENYAKKMRERGCY